MTPLGVIRGKDGVDHYHCFGCRVVGDFVDFYRGIQRLLDIKPDILETNEIEIDERFRQYLDKIKIKSKISIDVDKPKKQTYVLHYRK